MPERKVSIPEQLPYPSFFDILILIHPALPPLHMSAGVRLIHALVCAGAHERTHADPRVRPGRVHVDNVLHHGVVEKKAVYGTIAPLDEYVLESSLVEALDTFLAAVAGTKEFYIGVGVVGEEVDDLGE